MNYQEIADLLFMSERSVRRYVDLYMSTGGVDTSGCRHGPQQLLSDFEQITVLQSLVNKPTIYLEELQKDLNEATGTLVSLVTICQTEHRLGFTRKRVQKIALQRSDDLRAQYISVFSPEMLVWVDETGSDRQNAIRSYGYSLRGMHAQSYQFRVGGCRISAVGIMTTEGIEDAYLTENNVDGEAFEHFVRTSLLPILMPFNGVNCHSVVSMDNASIHHMEQITDMIHGVGALVRWLSPYSPDLNPVEEVFSQVKSYLKANESVYLSTSSPRCIISMAFNTVSQDHCINYIRHAGYLH